MNRLCHLLLLSLCLVSTVAADSSAFNSNCLGLDVIIDSHFSDQCSPAQGIHLNTSDCSAPTNGYCTTNKFFYANATIDSETNLPDQCCSLAVDGNFIADNYIVHYATGSDTPYCPILDDYITALHSAVSVPSIDSNGTYTGNVTVFQCQGIKNITSNQDVDLSTSDCIGDTLLFGLVQDAPICQGNASLLAVSDDNCMIVETDTFGDDEFQCPADMWVKGKIVLVDSEGPNPALCCKSYLSDNPQLFAKRTDAIQITGDRTDSNPINCPNGTFVAGEMFSGSNVTLFCAGFELDAVTTTTSTIEPSSSTTTSQSTLCTPQPTVAKSSYGYGDNSYGYFNRVADPSNSKAIHSVLYDFVMILVVTLAVCFFV